MSIQRSNPPSRRRNATAHAYTIHQLRLSPRTLRLRILLRDILLAYASTSHARRALQLKPGTPCANSHFRIRERRLFSCRRSCQRRSWASCFPRGATDREKTASARREERGYGTLELLRAGRSLEKRTGPGKMAASNKDSRNTSRGIVFQRDRWSD